MRVTDGKGTFSLWSHAQDHPTSERPLLLLAETCSGLPWLSEGCEGGNRTEAVVNWLGGRGRAAAAGLHNSPPSLQMRRPVSWARCSPSAEGGGRPVTCTTECVGSPSHPSSPSRLLLTLVLSPSPPQAVISTCLGLAP